MDFKQLQWCYILSVLMFILVFCVSKELVYYTTVKETNNRLFRFVCFNREPIPLVTVVLIIIDYICLAMIFAFNFVSLFLPENYALVLMLICNGAFLAFSSVAGTISHHIKKKYWESVG